MSEPAIQHTIAIRRLIDEVWNQRAFDVPDELFAADAIIAIPQLRPYERRLYAR